MVDEERERNCTHLLVLNVLWMFHLNCILYYVYYVYLYYVIIIIMFSLKLFKMMTSLESTHTHHLKWIFLYFPEPITEIEGKTVIFQDWVILD